MGDETCWTLIEAAGEGNATAREEFAMLYAPAVRAYLLARWGGGALAEQVDDAQQEVFVECLKQGGVLERAQRGAASGFRAFLYGAVRNVAARTESRKQQAVERVAGSDTVCDLQPADERSLSAAFDRAFAISVLRAAQKRHEHAARELGGANAERFGLLRERFHGGKSIAQIAKEQGRDAARLHHDYATARREFHEHLRWVVAAQNPGLAAGDIDRQCEHLVEIVDK